jgi:hypothetical protein
VIVPFPEVDKTVTEDSGYVFELSKTTPFNLNDWLITSPDEKVSINKNNKPVCKNSFNENLFDKADNNQKV